MKSSRSLSLVGWLCVGAAALGAADEAVSPSPRGRGQGEGRTAGVPPAFPLWDGHETVAQHARRVNLPEAQTLDLGNGVALELVLIPAGKFIMGTPEPENVNDEAFQMKIMLGHAVLAVGGGILVVLIGFAILRAIREKHKFQYSLRRYMAMMFAGSLCVLGGMHRWHSQRSLEEARAEYKAATARYMEAPSNEKPAYEVTIPKPFYMGKHEVTQEQYQQAMGANPSYFIRPDRPVEQVSWNDAKLFCKKVNEPTAGVSPARTGAGGTPAVGLPTDAEWEYACRAGTTTIYCSGDREADLARVAWYDANSGDLTHPVGQKEPNAWGLYDMHGNVWEWCEDWVEDHTKVDAKDWRWPASGEGRVLRGGSCYGGAEGCRSACRAMLPPGGRGCVFGFRVVVVTASRIP